MERIDPAPAPLVGIIVGALIGVPVALLVLAALLTLARRVALRHTNFFAPHRAAASAAAALAQWRAAVPGPIVTDQFTARMGHELRTPLNSVIGFSSVLLKNPKGNLSAQQLLHLSRIRDNGLHLLALVDYLLDASDATGAQRVRLTPVSLERLVRGTVEELASEAAADDVTLETEIPLGSAPITTDEHRFQAAFRSLVRGALPLAGHGSMTVRVAAPQGRPERIELAVSSPATAHGPSTTPSGVVPAELTLATSLYHLLGYPVTTEQGEPGGGATISVALAPAPPPALR